MQQMSPVDFGAIRDQAEIGQEVAEMSDSAHKQSTDRLAWASCREPYKSELDQLASLWINGVLSDEKLAFRALQMQSELDWVSQPDVASERIPVDDGHTWWS